MGQLTSISAGSILLSSVDRLTALNAAGGLSPTVSHLIALGEDAGLNLGPGISNLILLGVRAGAGSLQGDIIVIGDDAQAAGLPALPRTQGAITIGGNALKLATNYAQAATEPGSSIVIGYNALPTSTRGPNACVIIGSDIGKSIVTQSNGLNDCVIIGSNIFGLADNMTTPLTNSVLIGSGVVRGVAGVQRIPVNSVIIGQNALGGVGTGGTMTGSVVIGQNAAVILATGAQNILIGQDVAPGLTSGGANIIIGASANALAGATDNVCVGSNSTNLQTTSLSNVLLGSQQNVGAITGSRNIRIGSGCHGIAVTGVADNTLLIETFDGGTRRAIVYGEMNGGNTVLGRSVNGTNRDTPGTNILKLITGTKTGPAPAGGGFFYLNAGGVLRWVNVANDDQIIAGGIYTVATLPVIGTGNGSRAFVTDALAPVFGAVVAGGGAVFTPVYFDFAAGTWNVG